MNFEKLEFVILENYKKRNFFEILKNNKITILASRTDNKSGILQHKRRKYYYYVQEYKFNTETMQLETLKIPKMIIELMEDF